MTKSFLRNIHNERPAFGTSRAKQRASPPSSVSRIFGAPVRLESSFFSDWLCGERPDECSFF